MYLGLAQLFLAIALAGTAVVHGALGIVQIGLCMTGVRRGQPGGAVETELETGVNFEVKAEVGMSIEIKAEAGVGDRKDLEFKDAVCTLASIKNCAPKPPSHFDQVFNKVMNVHPDEHLGDEHMASDGDNSGDDEDELEDDNTESELAPI